MRCGTRRAKKWEDETTVDSRYCSVLSEDPISQSFAPCKQYEKPKHVHLVDENSHACPALVLDVRGNEVFLLNRFLIPSLPSRGMERDFVYLLDSVHDS